MWYTWPIVNCVTSNTWQPPVPGTGRIFTTWHIKILLCWLTQCSIKGSCLQVVYYTTIIYRGRSNGIGKEPLNWNTLLPKRSTRYISYKFWVGKNVHSYIHFVQSLVNKRNNLTTMSTVLGHTISLLVPFHHDILTTVCKFLMHILCNTSALPANHV